MLGNADLIAFVPTRDPQKSRRFYEQTLGLEFVSEDPFAIVFSAHGVTLRISNVSTALADGFGIGIRVGGRAARITALGLQGHAANDDGLSQGKVCGRAELLGQHVHAVHGGDGIGIGGENNHASRPRRSARFSG
jgi:catechol 2,3-dioxygenase-like lactoylglutathione lyase family enzyme